MQLERVHPLRILQYSGHAHVTEISHPIKGHRCVGRGGVMPGVPVPAPLAQQQVLASVLTTESVRVTLIR
jgi:hypothetical protein